MGYVFCDVMLLFVHHIVTRFSHSKAFFYSFGDYVLIVSLKVEVCLVSLYMPI